MGLRPTRGNENQRRHPRGGGGPFFCPMDSRSRGNDGTFGGAEAPCPIKNCVTYNSSVE